MPFPCDQCQASTINGIPCHEAGCPEAWKDTPKECHECGCEFMRTSRYQKECEDCQRNLEDAKGPFDGAFMQPEVYRGEAWEVETYNGTETVPADLIGLAPFEGNEDGPEYSEWLQEAIEALKDYCEGAIIEVPNEPRKGWLARMQAPGYMDSTAWGVYDSEAEAMADLERNYGNDA